jgi:hypothetical protein
MSLKRMLALAGLITVAACQNLAENQPLCSWFAVDEDNYRCVTEDPIDPQSTLPPAFIHPRASDDG